MSQNRRLVEYFTSQFYFKKTLELQHITSENFTFCINNSPLMSFEEYAQRRTLFTEKADLKMGHFTTDDDKLFMAEFIATTHDAVVVKGIYKIRVDNGLLQEVNVEYPMDDDEMVEFEAKLSGKKVFI